MEDLQQGRSSLEEYSAAIENQLVQLEERGRDIIDNLVSSSYKDENSEEVAIGWEGVQNYQSGVETLWKFVEDGDDTRFNEGLRQVYSGNQQIIEAMKINRLSRASLAELWDQLQQGY